MKKCIVTILISLVVSFTVSAELIKDGKFLEQSAYWKLDKGSEYKNIEPQFQKSFRIKTTQKSERQYLMLGTVVQAKDGVAYRLNFSLRAKGKGDLWVALRTAWKKPKPVTKHKRESIGLIAKFSYQPQWQNYEAYFISGKNPDLAIFNKKLFLLLGEFNGEVEFKDVSLKEIPSIPPEIKVGKNGHLAIVNMSI
ncbi:hypothetical protein PQO01_02980 [Lentisphaera marina]|uniref:hypothetical protein n=1 Tax=Lentisphaera marina TaxID=1111041 RepID=UPI002366925C|nr:hypothetical protein [Lentisphaera marina]MDD7983912.1 hypothetical protein [Lentisphaera marina]